MNDNGEKLLDMLDGESEGNDSGTEAAEGTETAGEEYTEVSEEVEQNDGEGNEELVEDPIVEVPYYDTYMKQLDDIINELIYQRDQLDSLQAYIESKDMTLFGKPLEKYTVQEGLTLLIFFLLLFMGFFKLVGGIITCKV